MDRALILHTPTILVVGATVGLAGSLLLARVSRSLAEGGTALPRPWIAAPFVQATVSLANAFRDEIPGWLPVVLLNSLQMLALGLVWVGAARLGGRHLLPLAVAIPAMLWLAACMVPGFVEAPRLRILLFIPLVVGCILATTLELYRAGRRHQLNSGRDLASVLSLILLLFVGQAVWLLTKPAAMAPPWGMLTAGNAIAMALFGTTLPFLMLAIGREQERAADGLRRAAALEAGRAEISRLH